MRPEKITVSIGNFPSRKCVLKKWNVKMNPAASNDSSECTTSAMLIIHPGMNRVKNTGYYITVYIYLINIDYQEIVYFFKNSKITNLSRAYPKAKRNCTPAPPQFRT